MANQQLVDFIKLARKRGYTDDLIRRSLLAKGWPLAELNAAFLEIKQSQEPFQHPQQEFVQYKQPPKVTEQEVKETLTEEKKPLKIITLKLILTSLGIFILITITLLVFFYMNGLMDYTVYDHVTQQEYTKRCLNPDCSDLKEYALSAMKDNIISSFMYSLIATLLIIVLYKIIKFKKAFLWILNILYLIFIGFLIYLWISFSS